MPDFQQLLFREGAEGAFVFLHFDEIHEIILFHMETM
jgi:hypothetical protein